MVRERHLSGIIYFFDFDRNPNVEPRSGMKAPARMALTVPMVVLLSNCDQMGASIEVFWSNEGKLGRQPKEPPMNFSIACKREAILCSRAFR